MPRISKKSKILELVSKQDCICIEEGEWLALSAKIAQLRPEDLQQLDIPVAAPWYGVRQHTLAELEESLTQLTHVYMSRNDLQRFCRAAVIRAKDHAKWASRSRRVPEDKRRLKAEMTEWMLVWLGDPLLFPEWGQLRKPRIDPELKALRSSAR